jgi:hypothetical protein
MSSTKPVFYTVANTPVDQLTEEELNNEADDLKREMTTIEARMGEKRVWTQLEGETREYLEWLAKSKNFHGRLMIRYVVVSSALRKLNRNKQRVP